MFICTFALLFVINNFFGIKCCTKKLLFAKIKKELNLTELK